MDIFLRYQFILQKRKPLSIFFISSSNEVVLGVDCISLLKLEIKFSSSIRQQETDKRAQIQLINEAPKTLIQPIRRLPFALIDSVEHEIRRLIASDIIEPIESSPYVSPIVIAKKRQFNSLMC